MKTSILGVIAALFAAAFILAACADDTGSTWTFAPTTPSETEATTDSAEPEAPETEPEAPAEATAAPEVPAEPETPAEPEQPPAASGEARVVQIQADGALRFTDADGQPLADIPVTPGETIRFQIDNTAGFQHNFWIGTDEQLSVPAANTEVGLPDWSTGVQELEWVVPEDITDLKFACTVPGHYYTMQGTFSQGAPAPATEIEPAEPEAPAEATAAPAEPEVPAETDVAAEPAAAAGEPRVIEFEADAAIRFMQDGEQLRELAVTPGETVIFRIDNTAGFLHNFYIGPDEELQVPNGTTEVGVTDWETGIMELEWVVPEDLSNLRFACTVPGHYYTMQGDFTISS